MGPGHAKTHQGGQCNGQIFYLETPWAVKNLLGKVARTGRIDPRNREEQRRLEKKKKSVFAYQYGKRAEK